MAVHIILGLVLGVAIRAILDVKFAGRIAHMLNNMFNLPHPDSCGCGNDKRGILPWQKG